MILFVGGDLMFAAPMQGAAKALGHKLTVTAKLADPWGGETPSAVVVDLAGLKIPPADCAAMVRRLFPGVKILAFGPHVQEASLQAAADAQFDVVMTRGQLSRDPVATLRGLLPENAS